MLCTVGIVKKFVHSQLKEALSHKEGVRKPLSVVQEISWPELHSWCQILIHLFPGYVHMAVSLTSLKLSFLTCVMSLMPHGLMYQLKS